MTREDFAVVELSSFQLMTMQRSPARAVITNLSPNHLNWHLDMDEYVDAKCNIYRNEGNQFVVLNRENETSWALSDAVETLIKPFSSDESRELTTGICLRDGVIGLPNGDGTLPILRTDRIRLPGRHNIENYMAAIAAVRGYAGPEEIAEVAKTFRGVRHRLELVRELGGVAYYNGSIDSSPTRTAAALNAMGDRSLVLICGGYDKQIPFAPLADALLSRNNIRALVLTGATAQKIEDALREHPDFANRSFEIHREADFTEAVLLASRCARAGDAVLLSPACASFDAFANFEKRGDRFCEIVRTLTE
jgi:UDP-N-acetylmuramoylalanine--D-glutamate ligase